MDRYFENRYAPTYIQGMTTLPERLDQTMKRRGEMSQSALARRSGVSQPSINRILKGITPNPDLQTLQKLSAALGVELEWLANDAGEPPNSSNRGQNTVLSDEAERLIQCVMRLDKAGNEVRQTFAYTLGILEIVERMKQVDDAGVVAELAEQEQLLALHAEPSRVLKHAPRKHK